LEVLRLLLELRVGLLELALLRFQLRLRLLEHPALFLELLVRDAQLLLLHLQLLALALCLLEQLDELPAVLRTAQRDADRLGDLVEHGEDARSVERGVERAELDDAADAAVGKDRSGDQAGRRARSE